ncbi:MAG: hypothetical protein Q7R49_02470 [Candidatus Daviesbacteria bacterium]|nr:hypothetical protein [Candidatus Daviesbacteria bacterium]
MEKEKPSLKTFAKAAWKLTQVGGAALFVASRTVGTLDDKKFMDDASRFMQLAHSVPADLPVPTVSTEIPFPLPSDGNNPYPIPHDSALRFYKDENDERGREAT